jgi:hypothetical protein
VSDTPELELLVEIAKLLKRYGPETFEGLAQGLSTPEFSERLVSVLIMTAKTGRTARPKEREIEVTRRRPNVRDFRSSLVDLGKSEPEKSDLLIRFYDELSAKAVLPTMRDIQGFASDMGLPSLNATARSKAIIPLVKALLPLPLEDLRARLMTVKRVQNQDDRSLEGWGKIILDKDDRKK